MDKFILVDDECLVSRAFLTKPLYHQFILLSVYSSNRFPCVHSFVTYVHSFSLRFYRQNARIKISNSPRIITLEIQFNNIWIFLVIANRPFTRIEYLKNI
jgi:hypothetical protein